ncbi:hypothetical protein GW17_00051277 [Ensete ventricosum]|nr:hypothetical protein GW17_00051277 [Ensete ventricosum]
MSWSGSSVAAPPPRFTTRATSRPATQSPSRSSPTLAGPPAPPPPAPPTHSSSRSPPSAGSATPTSSASTRCWPPAPMCTNLLLDDADDLKVSDFGLYALCSSDDLLYTQCGTPASVAPEILLSRKGIAGYGGAKADIWSCGVLLFVLHAGFLPFNDYNLTSLYRKIHRRHHRYPRWTRPTSAASSPTSSTPTPPPASPSTASGKIHRRISGGELNAIDLIISFASRLDLSGLFTDAASEQERFAFSEPADRIDDRAVEVGQTDYDSSLRIVI